MRQTAIYACGEIAVNDLMSVTKVVKMLVHVLGQISYKKGCFHYVVDELKKWGNKNIYRSFQDEVIEVHGRYEKFSEFSQEYVSNYFKNEEQL